MFYADCDLIENNNRKQAAAAIFAAWRSLRASFSCEQGLI
jgi:hypothetical protein